MNVQNISQTTEREERGFQGEGFPLIILCPKRRKKVLVGKIAKRLKEILIQVAKEKNEKNL